MAKIGPGFRVDVAVCSPQIHLNDAGSSDLSSRVCFVFFPQEFVKLICFTITLSRLSWEEKGLCQPTNKSSASTETTFATLLMQIGFWLCHLPHAIVWALKIVTSMPAAKSRQPETCAGSHILFLFLHRIYVYIYTHTFVLKHKRRAESSKLQPDKRPISYSAVTRRPYRMVQEWRLCDM